MKYEQSANECAELLRLVLPRLNRHVLAANPVNYAVWFDYFAGTVPTLRREIDARLAGDEAIDDGFIEGLFQRHVIQIDGERLDGVRREMMAIMQRMGESVHDADDQAASLDYARRMHYRYLLVIEPAEEEMILIRTADGENTCVTSAAIEPAPAGAELARLLGNLGRETSRMLAANSHLRLQLERSSAEMDDLRSELEAARAEAISDPLTGLANRSGFERAFERAAAESGDAGIGVLLLDVDGFKSVNDNHGHLIGDKVLRAIADALLRQIKGADTAGRLGGDEFSVLLPQTPAAGAAAVAEQIRASIAKGRVRRVDNRADIGQVTLSIGVADARPGESLEAVLERADAALYLAKKLGRNRVCTEAEIVNPAI